MNESHILTADGSAIPLFSVKKSTSLLLNQQPPSFNSEMNFDENLTVLLMEAKLSNGAKTVKANANLTCVDLPTKGATLTFPLGNNGRQLSILDTLKRTTKELANSFSK